MTQNGQRPAASGARDPETRLARYAGGRFRAIPGFLNEVAAALIVRVAEAQRAAGIAGPVAEIGVFAGRTTTLLYMLTDERETVVGIDLFEEGNDTFGHPAASKETVRRTVQQFSGEARRLALVKRDSGEVGVEELLSLGGGSPFRLFHIDGDHTGAAVRRDLDLALAVLAPRGVIVADDFFNPNTPEVFEAVWGFVSADTVVPFATVATKMFLCRAADATFYLDAVRRLEGTFDRREWRLSGTTVYSFRQPPRAVRKVGRERHGRLESRVRRGAAVARRQALSMQRRLPWHRAE